MLRISKAWSKNHSSRQLFLLRTIIVSLSVLSGCISLPSKQAYVSPTCISLEKPNNWDVEFFERSGLIKLQSNNQIQDKNPARIEIYGNPCFPGSSPNLNAYDELQSNIDRIRNLYGLDSVTVIQQPIMIEIASKEVIQSIITVPMEILPENTMESQIGTQSPDLFQTIIIYAIPVCKNIVIVFVYEGDSETNNRQANEIVNSIQPNCSKKP